MARWRLSRRWRSGWNGLLHRQRRPRRCWHRPHATPGFEVADSEQRLVQPRVPRSLAFEQRRQLGHVSQGAKLTALSGQLIIDADALLFDRLAKFSQGAEGQTLTVWFAHLPTLETRPQTTRRLHAKLITTVGAFDRGPPLRQQSVVELVLGFAATADD
jgi:hypothetical protein